MGFLASFLPCLPAQHDPAWKDALIKEGRRHRDLYTRVSAAHAQAVRSPLTALLSKPGWL